MSDEAGGEVVRVVIADDYAIEREGLRAVISRQPGLDVIGEASDGEEATRLAQTLQPDVLVLDLSIPPSGGAAVSERLTLENPNLKVIALSRHEERAYAARVLRAGVAGYVLKRSPPSAIVHAIRATASGQHYLDPLLAGFMLPHYPKPRRVQTDGGDGGDSDGIEAPHLTSRETEVLHLIAFGHTNREIAGLLSISVKTVESHRGSGLMKLGLANRAALVAFALAEGWMRSD